MATTFYHLTLNSHDGEDLLWAYEVYRKVLPAGVIPIACDGGGNQTCLDLRPDASVQVVVWDHEQVMGVRPAAKTFEELLDKLYVNPDYL